MPDLRLSKARHGYEGYVYQPGDAGVSVYVDDTLLGVFESRDQIIRAETVWAACERERTESLRRRKKLGAA